jgi:hypothetical protein
MNEFTCLCGPTPKGVSRVSDVDVGTQSRLEPHWAEFPVVAVGWAALNRQTSSLGRPDGNPDGRSRKARYKFGTRGGIGHAPASDQIAGSLTDLGQLSRPAAGTLNARKVNIRPPRPQIGL